MFRFRFHSLNLLLICFRVQTQVFVIVCATWCNWLLRIRLIGDGLSACFAMFCLLCLHCRVACVYFDLRLFVRFCCCSALNLTLLHFVFQVVIVCSLFVFKLSLFVCFQVVIVWHHVVESWLALACLLFEQVDIMFVQTFQMRICSNGWEVGVVSCSVLFFGSHTQWMWFFAKVSQCSRNLSGLSPALCFQWFV